MSNFSFLETEWPSIYEIATEAEAFAIAKPIASRMYARQALEKAIYWMFDNDDRLSKIEKPSLHHMLVDDSFKKVTSRQQRREIILLKDIGNAGVHGRALKDEEVSFLKKFGPDVEVDINSNLDLANLSLRMLFQFLSFFAVSYSKEDLRIPEFDESIIPTGMSFTESDESLNELKQKLKRNSEKDQEQREELLQKSAEVESLKKELAETRRANAERAGKRAAQARKIPRQFTEAETRKLYIDILLKEAGWFPLKEGREKEYEVNGMPISTNPSGIGYADYVLWGDDGKPLAVIEAKKTSEDSRKGKHQATLYANCLEGMHGQRPVIFYTNGYEFYLWDDSFYPEREVSGFFTKDELQLLVNRRETRKDLRDFQVNKEIAGRPYQLEAIQRVAENLATTKDGRYVGTNRASLLVMATGSGKTRTSSAIVEMLTKCNWAKRVLFLADRNALVTQAKNAFNEHLPHLSAIDLSKEKEDNQTRLVFSTYPSIRNKIDSVRIGDERFYGPGHFDLIIIDEAHRSVYAKYRSIFEYFDSLLLGLTATPKKDIDRNTYGLFSIEDDDPTFAYELDRAVDDGFLVPMRAIGVPMKFQRKGIKYHELSEEEKAEYEEKFGDPTIGEAPDEIGSAALNKWLFNADTVDKVLDHLMTNGIKVEGGDKLGKTIIFAKNHEHAVFIEKRFNKNYPEYSGKFLSVIDNYVSKAQDLLEKFCDPYEEQNPQIAVSVDMMDTGVDAPRAVNLVFFKTVKSSSKFWQMIGRGTRLCPDLFGPDDDKKEFVIFDFCQNFEFFNLHPDGAKSKGSKSLLRQIFESKLQVAFLIGELKDPSQAEKEIREAYIDELHNDISSLDTERYIVRKKRRYIDAYADKNKWLGLSKNDLLEVNQHLSDLSPPAKDDDELARRFDILILKYQLALLAKSTNTDKYIARIYQTGEALEKKGNIPQVNRQLGLIKDVQTEVYWQGIDVKKLDELRKGIRDLIKYLEKENLSPVYTHFEDDLDLSGVKEHDPLNTLVNMQSYRDRVERYVRSNEHHLTIVKLRNNNPITKDELEELERIFFTETAAESKDRFEKEYGKMPLGKFIRSILGMEQKVAQAAFAEFIQAGNLSGDQISFLDTIISYLSTNGTIDHSMLYEPPFTDINDQGISGLFDTSVQSKIVQIIDRINANAEVA